MDLLSLVHRNLHQVCLNFGLDLCVFCNAKWHIKSFILSPQAQNGLFWVVFIVKGNYQPLTEKFNLIRFDKREVCHTLDLTVALHLCLNLKVVSATFLLVCFECLKESNCETRKNAFYFTSKALLVLEIIKF